MTKIVKGVAAIAAFIGICVTLPGMSSLSEPNPCAKSSGKGVLHAVSISPTEERGVVKISNSTCSLFARYSKAESSDFSESTAKSVTVTTSQAGQEVQQWAVDKISGLEVPENECYTDVETSEIVQQGYDTLVTGRKENGKRCSVKIN